MDVRTYRWVSVASDHYLAISNIRSRISNVRKTYGPHIRKFNSERLKDPEVEARYGERINESLAESINSESVNVAWKALKEIIMMSADITLGKIGRVEHSYWFDAECEYVTVITNESYRTMQQRNHTRKAVEECHVVRREEKRLHKGRNITSVSLKNWNINESQAFYQKLNKNRKDFQPRSTLCKDKEDRILSGNEMILGR
jgi:hypothetical protein